QENSHRGHSGPRLPEVQRAEPLPPPACPPAFGVAPGTRHWPGAHARLPSRKTREPSQRKLPAAMVSAFCSYCPVSDFVALRNASTLVLSTTSDPVSTKAGMGEKLSCGQSALRLGRLW